jgi:tol-pal system protein YbgF
MRILAFTAIAPILALVLAAPAFAQNNDMRALMGRMDQLQRQMDTVSRQVYNGAPPSGAVSTSAGSNDVAGIAAVMDERMSSIEGSLKQLNNRMDEQDYALGQMKQQFDLFKSDVEIRLKEISTQTSRATPVAENTAIEASRTPDSPIDTNAATAASATADTGSVQDLPTDNSATLYDASFQALREQKYDRAEAGFKEFIKRYSDDTLAGNAQYWLGETYYVRGKYPEAAKVFATGYQKYPKSSKAPDNLLKLGLSLAQSGKKDAACVTFQQLGVQYQNAAAVIKQRATEEQKKLSCPGA